MHTKLTIGIATCNRISYLPAAVQSALVQNTSVPYDVIICDDASTDGTQDFLKSLRDSRVRVITREKNGGESAVRNQMVAEARGEFILWLDDDDILLPHAVQSHFNFLTKNPSADIISANLQFVDEHLVPRKEYLRYRQIEAHLVLYRLLIDNMLANGGTLIRKSVFDRVGPYNEAMPRSLDYEFWARCALKKCKFFHNDDFLYLYRAHSGNCMDPRNQDPQHHVQYAKVATKILSEGLIEEVFPMFNWREQPQASAAQALLIAALIYLKWEQFPEALDAIKQSEEFTSSREALTAKGLVYQAMGQVEEACKALTQSLVTQQDSSFMGFLQMSCLNVRDDYPSLFDT